MVEAGAQFDVWYNEGDKNLQKVFVCESALTLFWG